VVGSHDYGDELSGSGTTELVSSLHQSCKTVTSRIIFSGRGVIG
jgi:hypothetical protein